MLHIDHCFFITIVLDVALYLFPKIKSSHFVLIMCVLFLYIAANLQYHYHQNFTRANTTVRRAYVLHPQGVLKCCCAKIIYKKDGYSQEWWTILSIVDWTSEREGLPHIQLSRTAQQQQQRGCVHANKSSPWTKLYRNLVWLDQCLMLMDVTSSPSTMHLTTIS